VYGICFTFSKSFPYQFKSENDQKTAVVVFGQIAFVALLALLPSILISFSYFLLYLLINVVVIFNIFLVLLRIIYYVCNEME
jgi:Kef-type K+ transport system membrane component KefB